jgi:AcrR family transcriptional regulator
MSERSLTVGLLSVTLTERVRAPALSPDERRAAIVAATLPLLLERGIGVTTKQIADAAGIAEGTIFRVFPDKNALLGAVIDAAADTSATEAAIAGIDPSLPVERQIEEAVRILQRRMLEVWRVVSTMFDTDAFRGRRGRKAPDIAALIEWFERHQDVVRCDAKHAARALQGLTIGVTHPALYGDEPMDPADVASLFLDGLRVRGKRAAKGASC